ncbi:MAG: hypothetical protein AABW79_00495 [Nanoarchaeota archaeon]
MTKEGYGIEGESQGKNPKPQVVYPADIIERGTARKPYEIFRARLSKSPRSNPNNIGIRILKSDYSALVGLGFEITPRESELIFPYQEPRNGELKGLSRNLINLLEKKSKEEADRIRASLILSSEEISDEINFEGLLELEDNNPKL